MKSTIQIVFFAFLFFCSGCKKRDTYHIKFSKDIYLPQFFASKCSKLFDRPDIAISLNTFKLHTYMSPNHPIYAYCKDDNKIAQFFASSQNARTPFYIGNVNIGGSISLELFTFNGYLGTYNNWVTGYFSLKQPDGYTIIKAYESGTDNPVTLQPFIHKNYLLLWEETKPADDGVDPSKPKTIEVQYCILKIMNNGAVTVLQQQEAAELIKGNNFPDLPSTDLN